MAEGEDFIHKRQLDIGKVDKTAERVLENIDLVWSNYVDAVINKGAASVSQPSKKTTNLALIKTSKRALTQLEEKRYGNLEKDMLRNPLDFEDTFAIPRTPPKKFNTTNTTTTIDPDNTTESASPPLEDSELIFPTQMS